MRGREDLAHLALHLSKYAGEVAAIAEHAQHQSDPVKVAKARKLAARWLAFGGGENRADAIVWVLERLPDAIEGVLR